MMTKVPIYERIKIQIKHDIETGMLRPGAPIPSEHELTRTYHVSRHQTRQALRELELEGFVVRSQGKRSIVASAAHRIPHIPIDGAGVLAIALQSQDTLYNQGLLRGFQEAVVEQHLPSIAYNLWFNEQEELQFLKHVRGTGVSGLVLWLQHASHEAIEVLRSFQQMKFPVVLVDRDVPGLDVDSITTDNLEVTYQLTCALIERGHRRIGYISDPHDTSTERNRFYGYRKALGENGLQYEETLFGRVHVDEEQAFTTICRIMAQNCRPTAFCCIHELSFALLQKAFSRLGFRIPEDVELAAITDDGIAQKLGIPVLGAKQAAVQMGRMAVELLQARIKDPERAAEHRLLPAQFLFSRQESELQLVNE